MTAAQRIYVHSALSRKRENTDMPPQRIDFQVLQHHVAAQAVTQRTALIRGSPYCAIDKPDLARNPPQGLRVDHAFFPSSMVLSGLQSGCDAPGGVVLAHPPQSVPFYAAADEPTFAIGRPAWGWPCPNTKRVKGLPDDPSPNATPSACRLTV